MADLSQIAWSTESADGERSSFMVPVLAGSVDCDFEARSAAGVTVNAVLKTGEYVYMGGGDYVRFRERLENVSALELCTDGQLAYRCLLGTVVREEIVDPTPAVVHEVLTDHDHIAFAVRAEVERYLRALGDRNVFRDDIDPDELVDDVLNGDLDFEDEDEDDGFVSRSYEEMAEERPASPEPVSATSGGSGGGNEPPDLPSDTTLNG